MQNTALARKPGLAVNGKTQNVPECRATSREPLLQPGWTPNHDGCLPAQQGHGRQQPWKSQHMIAMHVADENALELLKRRFALDATQVEPPLQHQSGTCGRECPKTAMWCPSKAQAQLHPFQEAPHRNSSEKGDVGAHLRWSTNGLWVAVLLVDTTRTTYMPLERLLTSMVVDASSLIQNSSIKRHQRPRRVL